MWIEFKRKSGSVAQVEDQALDAAKRVFQQEALERVFIMTTIGVAFRTWEVVWDELGVQLVPLDGRSAAGTNLKAQYIDAFHPDATTLFSQVQQMKDPYNMPVYRAKTTIPSQPLPPMEIGATQQNMGYSSYGEPQAGPSNVGGTGSTHQWIEVKADRWKESLHNGEKIWSLRGKSVTYFTRKWE
ncbi:hypothetical protein COL26b_013896 [Colletotrichum chrysophilum]|uniref:uncharacterized protein n=1 Tax=Colletotrichum chrysophilum TaxID=1836956 RepID=UPI002300663E|nr:uncharacterized protein COL26b_013896 [Colletotrichum chrysophilum]KAJ0361001.1 hypothetical protein COL26b_013896 [Colletotrichum chrysophilum]